MSRIILHVDMNSFYASVECMHRPQDRRFPLAVGGDAEKRHGIILAKNEYAKRFGVKTGEAIWQAKQKCPQLIIVSPDYPLYMRYSRLARQIYLSYTNKVEAFGLDECWLDLSGPHMNFREAGKIAEEIHRRIIEELGVTCSVGISWNKVFAKLASDMNKPDGTVVITPDNYRERTGPLPVEDLLYVGPATKKKFHKAGIYTIGDLADSPREWLQERLGKVGLMLSLFARGEDTSPVHEENEEDLIKSIGNSVTTPRDLYGIEDIKLIFYALGESVAARLREQGLSASTLSISIRDTELTTGSWQMHLSEPTQSTLEIIQTAVQLYLDHCDPDRPVRSMGLRASQLRPQGRWQVDFLPDRQKREQEARIDLAMDQLRTRFGYVTVRRAYTLRDPLGCLDAKGSHIIAPVSFIKGGEKICLN